MQRQKQIGENGNDLSGDELRLRKPSVQAPDVHQAMDLLMSQEEKDRGRRSKRAICVCGARGCGIGPMREQESE